MAQLWRGSREDEQGGGNVLASLLFRPATPLPTEGETAAAPPARPSMAWAPYRHAAVRRSFHGEGDTAFWLFEPAEPRPATAPAVVFLHGWMATDVRLYGAWIEHIARRGNTVVFPVYQSSALTVPGEFVPNTVAAVERALALGETGDHVRPDRERLAAVGHSLGGALVAQLAIPGVAPRLPALRAAMLVQPGWRGRAAGLLGGLERIDPSLLMVIAVGGDDVHASDWQARVLFERTRQIPPANKNLIVVRSDPHGTPPLIADHSSPLAPDPDVAAADDAEPRRALLHRLGMREGEVDALDTFGYWKLFDGLSDAAFFGRHAHYALGDTREQRFMGRWSDGVPVRELRVLTGPELPQDLHG